MRDRSVPGPPEWLESLQRTIDQAAGSARSYHEAILRALPSTTWLSEVERVTTQLNQVVQPHQQMLAQLAKQANTLSGYGQLAKGLAPSEQLSSHATTLQDEFRNLNERVQQLTGYDSRAMRSTAQQLDHLLRASPGLDAFRASFAALDQLRAQPFLEYVQRLDLPALETAFRHAQPELEDTEVHAVAQALTEDAGEIATTMTDTHVSLLVGLLQLWHRLVARYPNVPSNLFNVLFALALWLASSMQTTRLETKIDRHAESTGRQNVELRRLIKERQAPPKPSPRTAVVQHAIVVRAKPSTSARIIKELSRGQQVTILASGRHWARIELPDKTTGWVRKKYLRTKR